MSAGLDASTLTPGMTAPVPSFTTPAIATCAWAGLGNNNAAPHKITADSTTRRMNPLLRLRLTDRSVDRRRQYQLAGLVTNENTTGWRDRKGWNGRKGGTIQNLEGRSQKSAPLRTSDFVLLTCQAP